MPVSSGVIVGCFGNERRDFPKPGYALCFGNFEDSFPKQLNLTLSHSRRSVRGGVSNHEQFAFRHAQDERDNPQCDKAMVQLYSPVLNPVNGKP